MNRHHKEILKLIQEQAGTPTQHTFLDSYLGSSHPRIAISVPELRQIAGAWMKAHRDLSADDVVALLSSLITGKSYTEKCMAGILLDYTTTGQREFDPAIFDTWLGHLEGWAEVDTLCTGKYTVKGLPSNWKEWKPLVTRFAKSDEIQKRRASLVLFCAPLRADKHEPLATVALQNIDKLKGEKDILITKAISWLLRSMEKHHRTLVEEYIEENKGTLPKIAVRETLAKLTTGRKTRVTRK
jgi:3-methyladenine DNA glycosylase AlkD